jgi:hypothetical protein
MHNLLWCNLAEEGRESRSIDESLIRCASLGLIGVLEKTGLPRCMRR